MDKKKTTQIRIARAEGPVKECIEVTLTGEEVWKQANNTLRKWSITAPKTGGYDKCDFWITWEDGETYQGRYDLKHWSCETADLVADVLSYANWVAGNTSNPHCGQEAYAALVQEYRRDGFQKAYQTLLDSYQIGDY